MLSNSCCESQQHWVSRKLLGQIMLDGFATLQAIALKTFPSTAELSIAQQAPTAGTVTIHPSNPVSPQLEASCPSKFAKLAL